MLTGKILHNYNMVVVEFETKFDYIYIFIYVFIQVINHPFSWDVVG